jgi:hypothetical protein
MSPHPPRWRKSSYSAAGNACVELGETAGAVLVRNSNRPGDGAILFTRAEVAAFVASAKAGELDPLAG